MESAGAIGMAVRRDPVGIGVIRGKTTGCTGESPRGVVPRRCIGRQVMADVAGGFQVARCRMRPATRIGIFRPVGRMGRRVRMTSGAVAIVIDFRHGSREQVRDVAAQKVVQRATMTVLTVNQVVLSDNPVNTWDGKGQWMRCRRVCRINMAL